MKTRSALLVNVVMAVACVTGIAPLPGLLASACAAPDAARTKQADATQSSSQAQAASLPAAAQSAISAAIGRDEPNDRAEPASGGFRMLNSAGKLAAEFAQSGVVVRAGASNGLGWGMAFAGYGRGKSVGSVSSPAPQANANRVEYHHGGLTEWYLNSPLGLEQGFTVAMPPATGDGNAEQPLTITLALSGDLTASLDSTGTGLTLTQHDGQAVLRYTGLSAQDAAGTQLRCWLELHGSQLPLRIDDAGARYPILVDPWVQAVQAAELTNSSGVISDQLGHSIAVSGNTVVVGALGVNSLQGAVYVFVEPAGGWAAMTSTPTAVLTVPVPNPVAIQQVGYSVAISRDGSTIVTGAPSATIGGNQYEGVAYVFAKPMSGWATTSTPTAELTTSDNLGSQNFGYSVAVNETGNTIVVGSVSVAAYVFNEPMMAGVASWSYASSPQHETAKLSNAGAPFSLVAISGNTVVGMGSYGTDADVFVGPVFPTPWSAMTTPSAVLAPSSGSLSGPVAISGSTVVVGANVSPVTAQSSVGAAYVFVAPGGVWAANQNENAVLTPSSANSICYDFFGASVGINETADTIVVGAYGSGVLYNSNCMIPPPPPTSQQGAAFVFAEPTANNVAAWTSENETQKLTASDATNGELLGYSVGISGNTVAAGAPSKTIGSHPFQGAAYVFAPPAVAALYSNPGPIDFGAVQVNTAGTYTLTLTNPITNSSSFMVTGVSLAGSEAANFSITSVVCNGNTIAPANYGLFSVTLNPNGTDECIFTLQFLPNLDHNGYAEDLLVATTATTSNASPGPGGTGQGFLMLGDGVAPYANFTNSTSGSPTQVTFGGVLENTTATQTVTLTNTGDGPLVIQTARVAPGQGFSYSQVVCNSVMEPLPLPTGFVIDAGTSCIFTVQFDPNALGPLGGALGLLDNAEAGESSLTSTPNGAFFTQELPLSGTGVSTTATTTTVTSTSSSFKGFPLPSTYALVGNPVTVNFSVQPGNLNPTGTVGVQDAFAPPDVCSPAGMLTSGEGGNGSCSLTFNQMGTGGTTLMAQYTPDAVSTSAGLLGSSTTAPQFTENLVQIVYCGPLPQPQSAPPGQATVFSFSVCLAGDVNAAVTATCAQLAGTPLSCSPPPTVTEVGNTGVYSVSITVSTATILPGQDRRPWPGSWPFALIGIGMLLTMLMAHHLAWKQRMRPRLLYAAGFLFALALLLGNINGCGSPSNNGSTGTQPGQYVMNVKVSAGAFSVTVPVTLNVT